MEAPFSQTTRNYGQVSGLARHALIWPAKAHDWWIPQFANVYFAKFLWSRFLRKLSCGTFFFFGRDASVMVFAYLGPGLGAGVILLVIGVVALVAITLFTFLWFPIKRMLKKRNRKS